MLSLRMMKAQNNNLTINHAAAGHYWNILRTLQMMASGRSIVSSLLNHTIICLFLTLSVVSSTSIDVRNISLIDLSGEGGPLSGNNGGGHHHHHYRQNHKCYVCLPQNRTSREAEEITSLFSGDYPPIRDCSTFSTINKHLYEFKCPSEYRGCLLKMHGSSVSRSCARFQLNDCKTANSVELCYCSGFLCNENKVSSTIAKEEMTGSSVPLETESEEKAKSRLSEEQDEADSRKFLRGETDDEDLLEMQDQEGPSGDGSSEPPGVVNPYTTTVKPTLVVNLRETSPKPSPTPTSNAWKNSPSLSTLFLCSLCFLYQICLVVRT